MGASSSNPTPQAPSPAAVAGEKRAREFLSRRKWRKARDELKPLVKLDRERFLPLLIEANVGLARHMLDEGQDSEARQVIDYLKTIAPAERVRALEIQAAGGAADTAVKAADCLRWLSDPAMALGDQERHRLADQMVLAFRPVEVETPEAARLANELALVLGALEAVANGVPTPALEALGAIPRRSPFSHWVLFCRGMAAFYAGEKDRAVEYLKRLPIDTGPERAGRSFRLLCGEFPSTRDREDAAVRVLEGACMLTGCAGAGRALWEAERLWRGRKHGNSYWAARRGIRGFPSRDLDWRGALTEFYFQAPLSMATEAREDCVEAIERAVRQTGNPGKLEMMLTCRLLALEGGASDDPDDLRDLWESYLRFREELCGANPRLESIAYAWLAERFARAVWSPFQGGRRGRMLDGPGAAECLERSLALDPENLPAHLQLCGVYQKLGLASQRNRLLDRMTERFPDDKEVLHEAGLRCIERKAYVKALGYLNRARHLDRLDPRLAEAMVTAHCAAAAQHYRKGKLEQGRKALEAAQGLAADRAEDFRRGRWTLLARRSVMESVWGEPAPAGESLAQAVSFAPNAASLALYRWVQHQVLAGNGPDRRHREAELQKELLRAPSAAEGASLVRLAAFLDGEFGERRAHWAYDLLSQYLMAAARTAFTRDEAVSLIDACRSAAMEELAGGFIRAILKRDPTDPLFRLFRYCSETSGWMGDPEEEAERLNSIVEEARRRSDRRAMEEAQSLLRGLKRPSPPPFDEPDFDDDEGPYAPPPDIDAEGPVSLDELFGAMPAGQAAEIAGLLSILARASDAELRTLRKSRPKDIPADVFELMVALARSGAMPPLPFGPFEAEPLDEPFPVGPAGVRPKSAAKPRRQPPAPPPTDPNQMDLPL